MCYTKNYIARCVNCRKSFYIRGKVDFTADSSKKDKQRIRSESSLYYNIFDETIAEIKWHNCWSVVGLTKEIASYLGKVYAF
jgi:hypothetical protein